MRPIAKIATLESQQAVNNTNQGRTVSRAFHILRALEVPYAPVRLSEISRKTGLHISTTQRILNILVDLGQVNLYESGYSLGPEILAQAQSYLLQDPLIQSSHSVLIELAESIGCTASVFVRSGRERILVARVQSPEPARYQFPIGSRLPLDAGAGKILLAFMPEDELEMYLAEYTGHEFASGERQTAGSLRAQLSAIRESGFQLSESERIPGTVSIATVIHNSRGHMVGTLNIVSHDDIIPAESLRKRIPELLRASSLIGGKM